MPVLLLSMVPALHFDGWRWVALALATPVVLWGAWPFHRAAWLNARHGAATMDTLVSLGVATAYLWSVIGWWLGVDSYLEVAAVVTVFLLAGRYAEARARRSSGAALRALIELGAKDVAVLRGRHRAADPDRRRCRSATCSSSGRARRSPPTASWSTAAPRSTRRC